MTLGVIFIKIIFYTPKIYGYKIIISENLQFVNADL